MTGREIQLRIAAHVLDVCQRHGLRVWADWGTLLGAVREGGMIPWDDDIDLMMMREDYERLIALAATEFRPPFFLQSVHTERGYYRGHAQVRYDGTAAILPADVGQPFHQGIFVDVFVYDRIPDDLSCAEWRRSLRTARLAQKCLLTAQYGRGLKRMVARTVCGTLGYKRLYRLFERQFTKWNSMETKRIACPTYDWRQVEREAKERTWYDETVMLPFEDIEMPTPVGYDKVLSTLYGADYMTPRQDSSGHGELIIDAEHDWREVLRLGVKPHVIDN